MYDRDHNRRGDNASTSSGANAQLHLRCNNCDVNVAEGDCELGCVLNKEMALSSIFGNANSI